MRNFRIHLFLFMMCHVRLMWNLKRGLQLVILVLMWKPKKGLQLEIVWFVPLIKQVCTSEAPTHKDDNIFLSLLKLRAVPSSCIMKHNMYETMGTFILTSVLLEWNLGHCRCLVGLGEARGIWANCQALAQFR